MMMKTPLFRKKVIEANMYISLNLINQFKARSALIFIRG